MIEVRTKYTPEMHKEFLRFLFFRGESYRYKQRTFTVLGILLIVLWFVLYFSMPLNLLPIVLLAVGIFVLLWTHLIPAVLSKQNAKETSSLRQAELYIIFNEDDISISFEGDPQSGMSSLLYKALYKVYETKNDFYLFLTPANALLVSKSDFISGSADELRTLFLAKLNGSFVLCK